jgi:hypothetical protein
VGILGIVSAGKRMTFNAQFASNASDSTGNYTTSIVNSVTFSAGNAVWGSQSPPAYIVTNEEGFLFNKKLTVTTEVNVAPTGLGQPIWAIVNPALDRYIRLTCITLGTGTFAVSVNGNSLVTTADVYPAGTTYLVKVEVYLNGLVKIYVNGILAGTGTVPVFTPSGGQLYIGYSPTATLLGLQGSMNYLTVEEG